MTNCAEREMYELDIWKDVILVNYIFIIKISVQEMMERSKYAAFTDVLKRG